MILSGTDYNNNVLELNVLMKEFYHYKEKQLDKIDSVPFCEWLKQRDYEIDTLVVSNIKKMFCAEDVNNNIAENIIIDMIEPNYELLHKSLEKEGFIFYNKLDKKLPWKSSIPV
jgi:hypothetical protein